MLKELIDKFYLDGQREKAQTKFYVTDAGKCPRAVFFKLKKAPKAEMDARILRVYEIGESLHRNIFNVLYRLRIGVTCEVPIPPQEIISGRADAILSIDNENYVLDIKSINSMIFKNMTAPKPENVYQIQLYLHFFDIKKGILLYIDKDRQELKEFIVEYDKNLVSNLLRNFEQLKNKVEKNQTPSALPDYPSNWQCNYCQFRAICDLAGPPETSWLKLKQTIKEQNQPGTQQEKPPQEKKASSQSQQKEMF